MRAIEAGVRLALKNILLLTDFSEPSELAIPFAIAIAREYESKVYAMHVLTSVPLAYATPESAAAATCITSEHFRPRRTSSSTSRTTIASACTAMRVPAPLKKERCILPIRTCFQR